MRSDSPSFQGAEPPERSYDFDSAGVRLRVHEWGDPARRPLLLGHGMWDHSRGFDTLAPLLAARFRVVAFDGRGHGDSAWCDSYLWPNDVNDVCRVLASLGGPVQLVGHSRGGAMFTDAACAAPELVQRLVNLDGLGPPKEGLSMPGQPPATASAALKLAAFLDGRRKAAGFPDWRPSPSLDVLMERRKAMNPRLSDAWLRYFVFHGSRHTADGVRWKVDPQAGRGFGPWSPDWIAPYWRHLRAPMLLLTGAAPDTWGPPTPAMIEERLHHVRQVEHVVVPDAGHFIHMERPAAVADLVLGFLGA
jgi:pimeloyl-ACP methyl ester carboxylesterase